MNQIYKNKLLEDVTKNPQTWEGRSREAALRLLTAICFRETAESAFRKTGSILLPSIGFYYAMFHMGNALLWLDPTSSQKELRNMKHAKLQNLLQSGLVDSGILPSTFLQLLARLQKAREYANYKLAKKTQDDMIIPILACDGDSLYSVTESEFAHALSLIRKISRTIEEKFDVLSCIAVTIGDHIGENVYSMYFSQEDENRIVTYLIKEKLST